MPIDRLLIQCPVSLKTSLNVPDKDFEQASGSNYLELWVERVNYKDGGTQYIRSFASPVVKKVYARGAEIRVVDCHSLPSGAGDITKVNLIRLPNSDAGTDN